MNWETGRDTPSFSSAVFIDKGITAAELEVENASSCAAQIRVRKRNGFMCARLATMNR